MIQVQILAGRQTGGRLEASRFPIQIGRLSSCAWVLDEAGVWDRHCEIDLSGADLLLRALPNSLVLLNDQKIELSPLRNGDLITLGAARLRFGFSPVRQHGQGTREALTWLALAALCLAQVALVYKLID